MSVTIGLTCPRQQNGWTLRVSRLTPDSTSSKLVNNTQVQTYTEIVDEVSLSPIRHCCSLSSTQLNSTRSLKLPSGQKARLYAFRQLRSVGSQLLRRLGWQFQMGWSNNPAWVFYDIALDKNYGLGNRVSALEMDKWESIRIAQYCDELVSDGLGGEGKEPRFLCDVYIQSQQDAYTVCAIFRLFSAVLPTGVTISYLPMRICRAIRILSIRGPT